MYVDMNSYFASCEQQRHPELRGLPLGVITHNSPNAAVIAASMEAKRMGVKTGMRLHECRMLCPEMRTISTHPAWYRVIHVDIMKILRSYCDDVIARSIDEAVVNFSSYRLVYKDLKGIARNIKADIREQYYCLTCSIGIAPNSFLAKLATEIQKPDGLIEITPDNIDGYLANLKLTDLPGIAGRNEHRLITIGIRNPLEMRHASPALLRKAFGGIVGDYWHRRLNFGEVDMYKNASNRTMSAVRTLGPKQRESPQTIDAMLVALCTRLEQRMVKHDIFCKEVSFHIRYRDTTSWDTSVKLADPVQDAMELRRYIQERMAEFERSRNIPTLFRSNTLRIGVNITGFVSGNIMQYSLFDNRLKKDLARKAIYNIKDRYGKNTIRKGVEMFDPKVMRDAIGFGSVNDMVSPDGDIVNQYLLEEEDW